MVLQVGDLQTALNAAVSGNGSDVSSQANLRIIELEAVHRQQMEDIKKKLEDAREKLKAVKDMRVWRLLWTHSNLGNSKYVVLKRRF